MTATSIDGKALARKINGQTARRAAQLKKHGITPRLEVVVVGEEKASQMYGRMKGAAAAEVGIEFALHHLPSGVTEEKLIALIKKIQTNKNLSGLILQLPLPEKLYTKKVLNAINPVVDVDFLTNESMGRLIMDTADLEPPTPGAVMTILRDLKINLMGKNITIMGTGALVGKPLAVMMMNAGASVTTCNAKTKNNSAKCRAADIIITGVGKKDLLRGNMVRQGAIVLDTGISFENGKVYGDAKADEVIKKASYFTPTPGGVGPVTVALLLKNTIQRAIDNNA